jgi:hypothetical protein
MHRVIVEDFPRCAAENRQALEEIAALTTAAKKRLSQDRLFY